MARFFRRTKDGDDEPAEGAALPSPNGPSSNVARKTPSRSRRRRGGAGAKKAARAGKTDATTAKKVAVEPDVRAGDAHKAAKAAPTRRRGSRSGTKVVEAAPAPPQPLEVDLPTVLQRQSDLIEKQTALLQKFVETRGDGDVGSLALEVKPRLAIFVDVPNILYGAERSGVTVDWKKVADFLSRGRTLVRAVAYAPISDDPANRRENERFVVPFVDKGYRIVTKPLKRFTGGGVKANFDVELAIDILTMADRLDVIALASGDGDFRRLVEIVGSRGVRVEVIAFGHSTSNDLREVADRYIDIAAYVPELCQ